MPNSGGFLHDQVRPSFFSLSDRRKAKKAEFNQVVYSAKEYRMRSRITSELLLVGSLPVDSTESALRAGSELFGGLVFALPDGETGLRQAWVGYEREHLCRNHPDLEVVHESESPSGIPRHAYETPVFR